MIDFEQLHSELLQELSAALPPRESQTGVQKLVASLNEQIALACCIAIKKYHEANNKP